MIKKILLVIILCILIGVVFFFMKKKFFIEKFEQKKIKIALFHAKWCHHCVTFIDSKIFEDAEKAVNNSNIEFVKYDFDKNKQLANKYNINGFPTIVALSEDGKLIATFEGDRSNVEPLKKFALTSIASA